MGSASLFSVAKAASVRALLFDISFLMLCHVAQTYGSEVSERRAVRIRGTGIRGGEKGKEMTSGLLSQLVLLVAERMCPHPWPVHRCPLGHIRILQCHIHTHH